MPELLLHLSSDEFINATRISGFTVIKLSANDPKWKVNMDVEVQNASVI